MKDETFEHLSQVCTQAGIEEAAKALRALKKEKLTPEQYTAAVALRNVVYNRVDRARVCRGSLHPEGLSSSELLTWLTKDPEYQELKALARSVSKVVFK